MVGWGKSLATVGLIAWASEVSGLQRSGRVLVLVGMGLYGAFAAGSQICVALLDRPGSAGVMLACAMVPLAGMAMVLL